MSKIAERIEALEQRLQHLKGRQQRIEAQGRSLEARQNRRADIRRKILVGGIVLTKVDQGVLDKELLREWLDVELTRAEDRELFQLPVGGG